MGMVGNFGKKFAIETINDVVLALFRKRHKIEPYLQWNANRNAYAMQPTEWCCFQWSRV